MEYTKTIALSKLGFSIDNNLISPVGVKNNYRVWGRCEKVDGVQQVILSPLPQKSWKGLLNIRIRVSKQKTIDEVLQFVLDRDNFIKKDEVKFEGYYKFNILSLNSNRGFRNHFVLNMIIEVSHLRCFEEHIKISDMKSVYENVKNVLNSPKFSNYLFETKSEPDNEIPFNPISVKWVKSLFQVTHDQNNDNEYNSVFIRLRYDVKDMLLKPERRRDYSILRNNFPDIDRPILFESIFDPWNKFIKLRPLNLRTDRIFSIKISYEYYCLSKKKRNVDIAAIRKSHLTVFLLGKIKKYIGKYDETVNIFNVSKSTTRDSSINERGIIEIHIETPCKFKINELKRYLINSLNERKSNDSKERVSAYIDEKIELKINEISPYKLFISLGSYLNESRGKEIKNIIEKHGFNTVFSYTQTKAVTENVINDIRKSEACIQIYSIPQKTIDQLKSEVVSIDHGLLSTAWLLFECGVARSLGKHMVRMIDTTHISKDQWKLHLSMDMDNFLQEYRTDVAPSHDLYFDNVLNEVTKTINTTLRAANYKFTS
jgi:hypothetical protein